MKRSSLSRAERITSTSEFKSALKDGAFYSGRAVKLVVVSNKCGISRIGVSLRKATFKRAVDRNKMRRRLKEIFRLNKQDLEKGYDIVVIPRSGALGLEFSELKNEFLKAIKKAGIYVNAKG